MKYLFKVLLFLLSILLILKFIVYLLNDGHKTTYVSGNFNILEKYITKDNNYTFLIKSDDIKLKFDVNVDYRKAANIITKIKYKEIDGYKCMLPIFKNNKILTDIMCEKDNVIYFASTIENINIKNYIKQMKKYGYNVDDYKDNSSENRSSSEIVYKDNILENHYLALENYKGLSLYSSENTKVKLFENDIYKKPISVFTDKYYIVADYSSEYTFKIFKVINIINSEEKEIRSYDEISFDSYVQGVVGDDIYIFDKDSKVQYKISLKYETVEKQSDIKYYNGSFSTMSLMDALNGKKFDNYYTKIDNVYKADKVGNYYYIYEKNGDEYIVYKKYSKKSRQKMYLFETSDINSIIYLDGFIYFRKGNTFYYYFGKGIRKVITNNELSFNDDITLGVYIK